jgi:molybdopterin converting factor small subunit
MQITVKLFALMREKVGTDTIPLEVPAGVAVTQALATLVQQ